MILQFDALLFEASSPHKTFVKVLFIIIMIHDLVVFTKTFSTCVLIQINSIYFVIVQFNFAIGTKKHFFDTKTYFHFFEHDVHLNRTWNDMEHYTRDIARKHLY